MDWTPRREAMGPEQESDAVFGVTARFVQNRTLSENGSYFMGFHKRSFAHELAGSGIFSPFCFQNPLSKSNLKAIGIWKGSLLATGRPYRTILNGSSGDPYFTDESTGGRYWFSVFHREDYRARDGQIAFRDEEPGARYTMNTRRNPEGKPVFLGATRLT